jgi:hypothetical protein
MFKNTNQPLSDFGLGEELVCRLNLWRKGHFKYMKGGVKMCQAAARDSS